MKRRDFLTRRRWRDKFIGCAVPMGTPQCCNAERSKSRLARHG
jgi:hypothetical protein